MFVFVLELQPADVKLCTDNKTHANFHRHFLLFKPELFMYKVIPAGERLLKCVYLNPGKSLPFLFVSFLLNY